MNLLIAGDVVIKNNNVDLFFNQKMDSILGKELYQIWEQSNYKIFNLEAPITNSKEKIKKNGPSLKIDPKAINGIKTMNPTVLMLSNNHIMDYGTEGLKETINILEKNNIDYIGVGYTEKDIKKSYVIEEKEKKIAIYNCCETEFSLASDKGSGANGCNLLSIQDEIRNLKQENDYVIIIYHGGKEHYRYPSPYLQKLCRKMVEWGADVITCQHSHCIGCYERYKNKIIVYGQGNFIFCDEDNEYWNTSILLNINIDNNFSVDYIPICKTMEGTRLANDMEKTQILDEFETRSKNIENKEFIEEKYNLLAKEYFNSYLQKCHGDNIFFKVLNKLFFHKLIKKVYSEKSLLALLNTIECEAHRELFIKGLKRKLKID